jgi:hypothetical protein
MADNIGITPGTGATAAADDIGGVLFQRIKVVIGADGVNSGDVSSANPLPVTDAGLPPLTTSHPLSTASGATVRQAPAEIWSASFSKVGTGLLETDKFTQRRLGTGMGVSQASGNLVITTGTTANSEYLARSTQSFRGAATARYKTILSQRIANNNFVMLLADSIGEGLTYTNTATTLTVTKTAHGFTADNVGQSMYVGAITATSGAGVPGRYAIASITNANTFVLTVSGWTTGGGTCDLFGWNFVRAAYSGTTATNASVDAQRNGWNSGDTTATINTTASSGHMMQIYLDGRNVNWADALVASSTTPSVTSRASRVEALPDDDVELYWFIWSYNGTTNPASTTTWTIGFVAVEDNANVPYYIAGIRPLGQQAALPVGVVGTVTTSFTQPALVAGTAAIGDVGQQYRANATGAASGTHLVSGASTNATVVKAGAGRLLGFVLTNNAAAKVYVKFHNQTTTPTAGSGVVRSVGIPAGGTIAFSLEGGIAFSTGIALTTVTGAADADTTAVAANDIVGDIFFA